MTTQKDKIIKYTIYGALYLAAILALAIISSHSVSASVSADADYITIYPGESGSVDFTVDNTEDFDIEDVSVRLSLTGLPLVAVDSSDKEVDDLDEGDDDSVSFKLKAFTDAKPGDYEVPYVITYKNVDFGNVTLTRTGSFGIRISAKTDLSFSVEAKDNIAEQQGKLLLVIVNKGLGEIKSVSVKLNPDNSFNLISSQDVFIGTISADSDDQATYDVIFSSSVVENPTLSAIVTYRDFDNKQQTQTVNLPVKIYTVEEAYQIGLLKKSYTQYYILGVVIVVIIWIIYRKIKKARKKKLNGIANGR